MEIVCIKTEQNDFSVEFEAVYPYQTIDTSIEKDIEDRLDECLQKIEELDNQIQTATNNADKFDYTLAVASGIVTGLIDSFFVGKFDIKSAKEWSNKAVNEFITKTARKKGYKGRGSKGAIDFLEKKYKVPQDNIWKGKKYSSAKSHHLDDLAHHPTPLGMLASIVIQFFRVAVFVDKNGEYHFEIIDTDPKELIKIWAPVILSGLINWMVGIAENYTEEKLDKEIPEPIRKIIVLLSSTPMAIEILKCVDTWAMHLVSDMGGSKGSKGDGMGIPGIIISLLKELSSLPILKNTDLPKIVNDLYVKGKLDMRNELAVLHEVGKQTIPVAINELIVRGFYFTRHLIEELRLHKSFKEVEWEKVVPFNNGTIIRMVTVASGTFVAVDMADAAIRASKDAAKAAELAAAAGPEASAAAAGTAFITGFVLRINFVGIGRFAIAIVSDVGMAAEREYYQDQKILVYSEMMALTNAKLYVREVAVWGKVQEVEYAAISMLDSEIGVLKRVVDVELTESKIEQFNNSRWMELPLKAVQIQNTRYKLKENEPELLDDLYWESL